MAKAKPTGTSGTLLVERAHLVAALTTVTKAVETRNTIPILANVWLAGDGDYLTLRATDLDIEITTRIPVRGTLEPITVEAKKLLDVARKLPAGSEICLAVEDNHMVVKAGRSRFKLAVIDAASFPDFKSGAFTASFEADLAAMFAPIQFAISDEETRFYLCGVFIHSVGDETRAVATDGHRLARVTVPTVGEIPAVIIPKKTVGLLPAGMVQVELSDTKIRVTAGETVLLSKLIEGTFPDYERVTPKNNDRALTADRAGLLAAVERVGVVADERSGKSVRVDLASDSVTLTIRGQDDEATEELAAEYGDEPMVVGCNTAYLAEMLRNVSGEKVTFMLGDESSPILVKGGDSGWLGVQMPMRVGAA